MHPIGIFAIIVLGIAAIAIYISRDKSPKASAVNLHQTARTKEHNWKLQETWEDYPTPNYNAVHTYCSVAFDGSEKTFYYRTRNPELKVGDLVYVPIGYQYEKKVGRIVAMKNYRGYSAPYPLEKTKHIKEKVQ